MVTPYLSRLRPAEPGPRLRPRPRSRFEPAPALPIDGPAIGSLGLSLPPASDAEAAGAEIELEPDTPYPHLAGPAVAATPGDQGLPPVRTAAPGPDDAGRGTRTRRAARAAGRRCRAPLDARARRCQPPARAGEPALASPRCEPAPAGNEQDAPPGLAAARRPAAGRGTRTGPQRESRRAAAAEPSRGHRAAGCSRRAGEQRGGLPADPWRRCRSAAIAPGTVERHPRSAPQPEHAPPERLPPGRAATWTGRAGKRRRHGAAGAAR